MSLQTVISFLIPALSSLALVADLVKRDECVITFVEFDHWQIMTGDAFDPNSQLHHLIEDLRQLIGLTRKIPPLKQFCDKL